MKRIFICLIVILFAYATRSEAQATQKKVDQHTHMWLSFNSNLFVSKHWFFVADLHIRENDFFASNSFVLLRTGLGYEFNKDFMVEIGYGNLLANPTTKGWTTQPDENRIFEMVQLLQHR